jgi:hypothetical protein
VCRNLGGCGPSTDSAAPHNSQNPGAARSSPGLVRGALLHFEPAQRAHPTLPDHSPVQLAASRCRSQVQHSAQCQPWPPPPLLPASVAGWVSACDIG